MAHGVDNFGKKVALEGLYGREAKPEDRDFGKQLFEVMQQLLDRGLVYTHPVKIGKGGWHGVLEGVDVVRNAALSGQKLVYRVS